MLSFLNFFHFFFLCSLSQLFLFSCSSSSCLTFPLSYSPFSFRVYMLHSFIFLCFLYSRHTCTFLNSCEFVFFFFVFFYNSFLLVIPFSLFLLFCIVYFCLSLLSFSFYSASTKSPASSYSSSVFPLLPSPDTGQLLQTFFEVSKKRPPQATLRGEGQGRKRGRRGSERKGGRKKIQTWIKNENEGSTKKFQREE